MRAWMCLKPKLPSCWAEPPAHGSTFSGWGAYCARFATGRPFSTKSSFATQSMRGDPSAAIAESRAHMLTGDLVRPRLRRRGNQVVIDRLDERDPHWQQTAADLIGLFNCHQGQPRETWDAALEAYEGERTDYVEIRGFAKVLCDAATFKPIQTPLPPAELRDRLFARGPAFDRPFLFRPNTRGELLADMAQELQVTPEQIEAALFADRPSKYLLLASPIWQLLLRNGARMAEPGEFTKRAF